MPKIDENLPLIAFEVICSEAQKEIRRDIANLVASKPCLAIFVLIRNQIKFHPREDSTPEQWFEMN